MNDAKAAAREKHDKGPRVSTRSTHNHNWLEGGRLGLYCSRAWCFLTLIDFRWSRNMTTAVWDLVQTAAMLVIAFSPPLDNVNNQNKVDLGSVVVGFTTLAIQLPVLVSVQFVTT